MAARLHDELLRTECIEDRQSQRLRLREDPQILSTEAVFYA